MAGIYSVAGSSLGISAALPATYDATGYAALTYTNIGNIDNMGEHGRVYAPITFNPIDTRATRKLKGSFNEGNKTISLAYEAGDAGMLILKNALLSDADFSFKNQYQSGDVDYFIAKVMSLTKATSSVDDIFMATIELSLSSSKSGVGIVEVLAP